MNKRRNTLLSLFLAAAMLFAVTACNRSVESPDDDKGEFIPGIEQPTLALARNANDYSEVFKMVKFANDERFGLNETSTNNVAVDVDMAEDEAVFDGASGRRSDTAVTEEYNLAMGGGDVVEKDFSDTNNQVEGVQESDIVKTDGKHIFIASNNYDYIYGGGSSGVISVVKPDDGDMELVAQIRTENAFPHEMLLYDGKLIVIWDKSEYIDNSLARSGRMSPDWGWGGSIHLQETIVEVYDLDGDFSAPSHTYSQDGRFISTRMIDNNIYLLTNFVPNTPVDFTEDEIEYYIPTYTENGEKHFIPAYCIVLPEKLDWVQYTIIGGLDVNETDMSVSISTSLGSSQLFYASMENVYVIRNVYEEDERFTDAGNSVRRGGWHNGNETFTVIDKFAVDSGQIEFVASGKVRGSARNQFHFDEHNGIFRAVTQIWGLDPEIDLSKAPKRPVDPDFGDDWEKWGAWYDYNRANIQAWDEWWWKNWGNQGTSLYTLDENMNTLAEIHGIAKGEDVQSVRFMGNIGYIVTFLNVDPLFSFDLSDPRNPVQLDELKIPGFSRYMHPWGDGLLLGMGVDANEDEDSPMFGLRTGLKLSMFDTVDNENLSERHVYIISNPSENSWSNSPVEWEHRAALVAPGRNIIGFPYSYSVSGEDSPNSWYYNRFTVYAVFSYDDNGFTLVGEIVIELDENDWWEFNRGLYIGDYLYAISNNVIISANLNDFTQTQTLKL